MNAAQMRYRSFSFAVTSQAAYTGDALSMLKTLQKVSKGYKHLHVSTQRTEKTQTEEEKFKQKFTQFVCCTQKP